MFITLQFLAALITSFPAAAVIEPRDPPARMKITRLTGEILIKSSNESISVLAEDKLPEIPAGAEVAVVTGEASLELGEIGVSAKKGDRLIVIEGTEGSVRIRALGATPALTVIVGQTVATIGVGDEISVAPAVRGASLISVLSGSVGIAVAGAPPAEIAAGRTASAPPDPLRLSRQCFASFPGIDTLVERFKESPPSYLHVVAEPLVKYHACRALGSGNPGPCERLKGLCFEESCVPFEELCTEDFNGARFTKALATESADAAVLCAPAVVTIIGHAHCRPETSREKDLALVRQSCSVLLQNLDNLVRASNLMVAMCPTMRPTKDAMAKILESLLAVTGKNPKCSTSLDQFTRVACEDYARFHEAYRAKNPELCGDNGICRQLMGDGPQNCEHYAWKVKAAYCGQWVDERMRESGAGPRQESEVSPRLHAILPGELQHRTVHDPGKADP